MVPLPLLYTIMAIVDIIILLICLSVIPWLWPFLPVAIAGALGVGAYYSILSINNEVK